MIGASVLRLEDGRFLTGRGSYVDDLAFPGTDFKMPATPHRVWEAIARSGSK